MATIDTIIDRATFATLGLSTLGAAADWDDAVSDYLRLDALQHADSEVGRYADANEDYQRELIRLEGMYGKDYRAHPQAKASMNAAYEKQDKANKRWCSVYLEPYWKAAIRLAETPAPTIAAALFKEQVMYREDLNSDNDMKRDCMELLHADFARLLPLKKAA